MLVAEGTKFLPTSYSMEARTVLGLFVENRDAFAHSFDLDALDIHVQVPSNAISSPSRSSPPDGDHSSSTAPSPANKSAGMVGDIDVR